MTRHRTSAWRGVALLLALVLASPAALAAAGEVTQEDIAEAEAAEEKAAQRLADVREELAEASAMRDRMTATLESLTIRSSSAEETAVAEAVAVRDRLTRMYMVAGRSELLSAVSDVGGYFTRLAYLGAIAERDRSEVNRFAVLIEDLDALRRQAEVEIDELAGEVAALELLSASRAAALTEASEHLRETREQWAEQEAARRAALEAELRRQEAELARQAAAATSTTTTPPRSSTTTTTTTTATTTTAPPDDGGYAYDPGGGAEQWRPLLTEIFARWGLDREKCGPDGCVGSAIDGAMTIMWCESRGVPWAVNPSSGTTGLFQHRPVFWSERVNRTRSYGWSQLPADATPYNAAHNIEVAALLVYESRETLIGNYSFSRPWSDGPQPFGHWDSTSRYCADPPLVWP